MRQFYWIQIALLNLLLVAFIGVILRYKIVFSLAFIDQKHLLHGHSHFAFSGWISMALMTCLIAYLEKMGQAFVFKKYKILLLANLLCAYGMLVSFILQGYGLYSISFSTLSIFTSYAFAFQYWKDLNRLAKQSIVHAWFKAALLFNAISSLGAFALAYMMANHIAHQNWYLSAVYFFLHFQYNGWFFFACMGLLFSWFNQVGIDFKKSQLIFWLFAGACTPAYYLSALWMPMYPIVYMMVILAAMLQVVAFLFFMKGLYVNRIMLKSVIPKIPLVVLSLSLLALSIKLFLQLGSTHPALSQLAFGFRPIVIAYLHLVLLGVITLFLIGYFLTSGKISVRPLTKTGAYIFAIGIFINEFILMMQGLGGILCISFPHANEYLLIIGCVMFLGILLIVISQFRSKEKPALDC